ncbi:BioY family transporter [Rhodospirillum rubrum]|uniref:biotin transporter BioY n=1 Tax=Rhodospirillum rubrum TaxID=1085 RepID=UPI001908CBAF|nr:biotin transporter BioY [Rhodospirillum rubrum]MBK1665503.1 BioY family transporter [Rhodospirillum rubrum]MBK1677542.1 BioY family transporter [Rhodospirillum rubrum]
MTLTTRDLVLMGLFAAVMAALGLLPQFVLPLGVPVTAQSMGVMLAGAILGARRGFGAIAIFVALVALGLPLLAGGRGGLGVFAGPSGGFVIGFPIAAWAVGLLVGLFRRPTSVPLTILACVLGGVGVLYAVGIPYWVAITGNSLSAVLAIAVNFLPGDAIKAVVAGLVAVTVRRGYPALSSR